LRDSFVVNVKFTIRLGAFTPIFFYLFRDKLWVGLGLGVGIGLGLCFWTAMLFQDQQQMQIQEHVLLGKITATTYIMSERHKEQK